MTELSNAQIKILGAAAAAPETEIRDCMRHIKSKHIQDRTITSLLRKKLITVRGEECVGNHCTFDDKDEFVISKHGLTIAAPQPEDTATNAQEKQSVNHIQLVEAKPPRQTNEQIVIELLKREKGATLSEIMKATGWQNHSVRGSISNLKKKKGLPIDTTLRKSEKGKMERCYSFENIRS
jgi:hypothetical protein